MIKNADYIELNKESLELSLYRSFLHKDDAARCATSFIDAICKALNFDTGVLLKKMKNGRWKINKHSPNYNPQGKLDISKQFVSGVRKDSVVYLENDKMISGIVSDAMYTSQLFVSINEDSILLLHSISGDKAIKDYSWLLGPCKAFYRSFCYLIKEKHYDDIADEQLNKVISKDAVESANSERLLESLLNLSSSSFVSYNNNLEIIYFNDKALFIHKEFLGIDLKIGMHIDELSLSKSSFWNKSDNRIDLLGKGKTVQELFMYDFGDGVVYMNLEVKPILDKSKNIIGYMESATDITEVTKKNQRKRQQISTLNAVLNSTDNSIYALDSNMVVIAINQNSQNDFYRFCGKRPEVGDDLNEIIDPQILSQWKELYYDKIFKGEIISFEGEDSSFRVVDTLYTPVKDKNGKIIGCLELCRDISELSKSKHELEIRESQLRILVENVPTGIIRTNGNQEIIDISNSVSKITGYELDEIKNQNLYAIIHKDEIDGLKTYIDSLASGSNKSYRTRLVHKNGSIVYVEGLGSVITDSIDDKLEHLLTFNDVTEKVKIEENLKITKGNYNRLFKNLHDGVVVFNFDKWEVLDYNDAFVDLYGSEDFNNVSMKDILPETTSFLPQVNLYDELENTVKAIKKKKKLKFTTVLLDHNKKEKLVEISIFPSNEDDAVAYVILKDITKAYVNSLDNKQMTAIYEKLISESSEGIDIIEYNLPSDFDKNVVDINVFAQNDKTHKIVVRNDLMNTYLDNTDSTLTSLEDIIDFLTPIQLDNTTAKEKAEKMILDTITNRRSSLDIRVDNGRQCYDFVLKQNIINVNKKLYIIRHLVDITEKIKSEKIIKDQISDLNVNNEELQKYIDSNLQLENFAYIASHDLKAPIRSVISFMQLLKKNIINKVDEKDLKFVDIVLAASTNMQVLIDDLLDYSRINTQAVVFDKVDINKLLKFLKRDLITTIEDSETTIIIDDMPEIYADESRLRQVFQNLITNGIKFIDKNGTKPHIKINYKELSNEHLFSISDNGIGIEADYLDKIFLMFKKLHSENRYTGTGIGLSICKKVTEQHKGKIWVESELGKGSTFYFTICKELHA